LSARQFLWITIVLLLRLDVGNDLDHHRQNADQAREDAQEGEQGDPGTGSTGIAT